MISRYTFPLALLMAGCGSVGPQEFDETGTSHDAVELNQGTLFQGTLFQGTLLQGTLLQGTLLQGTLLQGTLFQGTSLDGMTVAGPTKFSLGTYEPIHNVHVDDTELVGEFLHSPLSGAGFVGSRWEGFTDNGQLVKMRIDDYKSTDDWQAEHRINLYKVSAQVGRNWVPFCDGGDAIPVRGLWGTSANPGGMVFGSGDEYFTWACVASSMAKCANLGYRSGGHYEDGGTGRTVWNDLFQACVRALRADYCGNGTSMTHNGTEIDLYDNRGIVAPSADQSNWILGADWTLDGARCIASTRWNAYIPHDAYVGATFETVGDWVMEVCGDQVVLENLDPDVNRTLHCIAPETVYTDGRYEPLIRTQHRRND